MPLIAASRQNRTALGRFCASRTIRTADAPSSSPSSSTSQNKRKSNAPRTAVWTTPAARRRALVALGRKLGIKDGDLDAWYKVTRYDYLRLRGDFLPLTTRKPLWRLLKETFPEHSWDESRFVELRDDNAPVAKNQRKHLLEIGSKLGIRADDYEAWYRVSSGDIVAVTSPGFLHRYQNSVYVLLTNVFPEHKWDPSKFLHKPLNFWEDPKNQRQKLIELGTKLGIAEGAFEDWYSVRYRELVKVGGSYLLKRVGNSVRALVTTVFPEHNWEKERFRRKNSDYWESEGSQRARIMEIMSKLSSPSFSSWYEVSPDDISREGGGDILRKYGHLRETLMSLFPEHDWLPWKFASRDYIWLWREPKYLLRLVQEIEEKLNITDAKDWERVTKVQLDEIGLAGIIKDEDTLRTLLTVTRPEHGQVDLSFAADKKKNGP